MLRPTALPPGLYQPLPRPVAADAEGWKPKSRRCCAMCLRSWLGRCRQDVSVDDHVKHMLLGALAVTSVCTSELHGCLSEESAPGGAVQLSLSGVTSACPIWTPPHLHGAAAQVHVRALRAC